MKTDKSGVVRMAIRRRFYYGYGRPGPVSLPVTDAQTGFRDSEQRC